MDCGGEGKRERMPRDLRDIPAVVFQKKTTPDKLLVFALVFALLIGDTAAGLACGLAGSLAFAAAAVLGAFAKITGFEGLDMFHYICLPNITLHTL